MINNKSRAEARPLQTMTCTKANADLVWKQLDDLLVPRLQLGPIDRAAYCYLLRHSRLEGKLQVGFSLRWLARGTCVSTCAARPAVRRLTEHGALRLVECNHGGHVAEVRLPEEILADLPQRVAPARQPEDIKRQRTMPGVVVNLEEEDFLRSKTLRRSLHEREGGRCFYCLRRLTESSKCLDHVVPWARSGSNSYRNLVSCCRECNSQKGQCRADDFLRSLFRDRQLTAAELAGRLRALDALAAGKLRPPLPEVAKPAANLEDRELEIREGQEKNPTGHPAKARDGAEMQKTNPQGSRPRWTGGLPKGAFRN